MQTYRRIETETEFIPIIWEKEESLPKTWREASHVWTPTLEAFRDFWANCGEIYGLFDGETLQAVVYLELRGAQALNIHVSVSERIAPEILIGFWRTLKRAKYLQGAVNQRGWIWERNKGVLSLARAAGYFPTGLKMDFGSSSNGRVFRWIEVCAVF